MEGQNEQQPRPNPRFAGIETFLVIGVETVSRGITQGEVGAIVGGTLLLLFCLAAFFIWRCWGASIRHRLDTWFPQPRQGRLGRGDERAAPGAAIEMAVLPPAIFRRP